MYKGKDLVGRRVVDHNTGEELHKVKDIIFSGVDGRVLGLLLDEGGLLSSSKVLPVGSIETIGPDAILVQSKEAVVSANESDDINTRIKSDNVVVGTKLMTDDGRDLGKITDIYFDETTGRIKGYEVSGGIFSDAYTGRSYLPTPSALRLGEDVAFVPDQYATMLEEQTGGIKGTVDPYLEKAHAKYEDFKEVSKEKYDQFSAEAKTKYDQAKVRAELLRMETSDKMESFKEVSKEKYSDLSADARARYDETKAKYDEMSDEAKAEYRKKQADMKESMMAKTLDEAKGRRANHTVYTENGSIIVAAGQVVGNQEVEQAKARNKSEDLLQAVNLSSREAFKGSAKQNLQSAGSTASAVAGSAWQKFKSKAKDLTGKAGDKVEEERIKRALGRPTNRVVLDKSDQPLLNTGEIITRSSIDKARDHGVLDLLLGSVDTSGPDLSNEDLKMNSQK